MDIKSVGDLSSQLDLLLFSGGDAHDTTFEKSRTGASESELWFADTSATSPGRHCRAAARDALAKLTGHAGAPMPLTFWFNSLRARIASALGFPEARVLLAPSSAEARILARFIATALLGDAPVEIVASPDECCQFPEPPNDHTHRIVELRDGDGLPSATSLIDARALGFARWSIDEGEPVLVHALDISRSGLLGISRSAARHIREWSPKRALALVDASEFRASSRALAADLAEGAMVIVSGSQFMAGPAHCAALVLPPALCEALRDAAPLFDPEVALARFDAPLELRGLFAGGFDALMNVGLGLRWSAALAEFDRFHQVPPELRHQILDTFARRARAMAARREFIDLEPRALDEDDPLRASILSILPRDPGGGRLGTLGANIIRAGLAIPRPGVEGDVVCHIGAPVRAGLSHAALPLSASAALVSTVAGRIARGISFERAIAPVWRDLNALFSKWEALAG